MVTRREFIARTYGDPSRANNHRNTEDSPTHPPIHPPVQPTTYPSFCLGVRYNGQEGEFKIQERAITICLITVARSQTELPQTKPLL